MSIAANTLDIYLHFPFCDQKCNFCYIDVFKNRSGRNQEYIDSLIREIESFPLYSDIPLRSVFFGGGTPSLMTKQQLKLVADTIRNKFQTPDECIFTIESTPNEVTPEKIEEYNEAGIRRVSVGIQSFDDDVLKAIGRPHSSKKAIQAVKDLRKYGMYDVCIELMWAIIPFPLETIIDDFKIAADLPIDMLTTMWYDIYQEGWSNRPAPQASKRYNKEFPNQSRDEHSVFAGQKQIHYSCQDMVSIYTKASQMMFSHGFERVAIDELRRSNFEVPPGLCLNGPGLSYTDNGKLLGFGYDALSSLDNQVKRFTRPVAEYIKDPLSEKSTHTFTPETLVWYRVVFDIVVPGEFDIQEYIKFAPEETKQLKYWLQSALQNKFLKESDGQYLLTDSGASFFNFAFGVENNHNMALKVRHLFDDKHMHLKINELLIG